MNGESVVEKAEHGNWVSWKFIYVPIVLTLLFGGLAYLFPVLLVVAGLFLLCSLYFAYARYQFSSSGEDIQARIQDLVVDHISGWDGIGKVLDIGCGNGPLTIQIAKRYPQSEVIGIDTWGNAWEYSKEVCDRNAAIGGVAERVTFEKASATSLPFGDETFTLVISNLVFHNISDVRDKSELIREALRVVEKGGWFVYQDLFLWKQVYGEIDDLLETIRREGIETVEFVDTSNSEFIPVALKLPFMLGTVGILYGRK
jgi:SAM-dependent methyltransferase